MSTNVVWFIERNGVRIRYTYIPPEEEDFYVSNIKTLINCASVSNEMSIRKKISKISNLIF